MNHKQIVAVTRKVPEAGLELLRDRFELKINPHNRVLKAAELSKLVTNANAVLALLTDKITDQVLFAAGKELKVVANYAVGYDNIDLAAAKKRKVVVTNTPDVLTEAVAEHAFALMMSVARRIVESDDFLRKGRYKGWEPELLLGRQLRGKTLGILGLGRIGSRVAEIGAKGYGMSVLYYDRGRRNRELDQKIGSQQATVRKLLTSSDFVSIHVPLTQQTRHMIGRPELVTMKKTAILINTARGPIVDEKALAAALKKGVIWGAGLDVFEFEPKVTAELKRLKSVVMTPHTASATEEARDAMAVLAAKNIIAVLSGKAPLTPVK